MESQDLNSRCPYAVSTELDYIREVCTGLSEAALMVVIGAGPGVMLLAAREGGLGFKIVVIDIDTIHYAEQHLLKAGLNQNVMYVLGDSAVVGRSFGSPVDFLIIDGDHTYEGVSADLVVWLGHVKVGGLVFLHDYEAEGTPFASRARWPGVKQAVSEYLEFNPSFSLERTVGTAIVYRRLV